MIADVFSYWAYSVGWSAVRKMPERRAYSTCDRLADQAWRRRGKSVLQYEQNLRRVVPQASSAELRELSRAGFRSYARYWCDAFRMPDWPRERIFSLHVEGKEHLDNARATGNGRVVFACPHGGNYDHGAAWVAQAYGGVTTVAEHLKPDKLFRKFVAFREAMGLEVLGTGTPDITETLVDRVESGRVVGLVSDRDLSRRGIPVTFFGEPTRMPAGPVVVARRTGATLLAANSFYRPEGAAIRMFPPIPVPTEGSEADDVAATMQLVADRFAEGIARHPSDWHMLQPLWVADLDPAREARRQERS